MITAPINVIKIIIKQLIIAYLFFYSIIISALEIPNLYYAKVPIENTNNSSQKVAFQEAIKLVLIKVSGDINVTSSEIIKNVLKNPDSLIQSFHFSEESQTDGESSDVTVKHYINIKTNEHAIKELLTTANFPVFGKNRPKILIWLAIDNGIEQNILSFNDEHELNQQIQFISQLLGIPILLPSLDLQDISQWSTLTTETHLNWLNSLKERYGTDAILEGNIKVYSDINYTSQWLFFLGNQTFTWQTTTDRLEDNLHQAFNQLSLQLSRSFAANTNNITSNNNKYTISVSNIGSLQDYVKISTYLKSIELAKDVDIYEIDQNSVKFSVSFSGELNQLQQVVSLNHQFIPEQQIHEQQSHHLNYRWTE